MPSLSFLVLSAAFCSATKLLLPLYQYPLDTAWDPVYAAIEAHPELVFQIILNADSGPGGSAGPDSYFATGTAKLNSYANVETLGYVHCRYGEASHAEVAQNVSDWAAWRSYAGANATVGGIFFDEAPNTQGGADDVSFLTSVVGAASAAFGAAPFTSMLNPGSSVEHAELWGLADYIVVFEADAAEYSAAVLTTNIPAGKAAQSSILIYHFASSAGDAATAAQWLQGMTDAGVGSAHILDESYLQATTAHGPASIASVAVALAVAPAANGPAPPASSAGAQADTNLTVAPTTRPVPFPAVALPSSVASDPTVSPSPTDEEEDEAPEAEEAPGTQAAPPTAGSASASGRRPRPTAGRPHRRPYHSDWQEEA